MYRGRAAKQINKEWPAARGGNAPERWGRAMGIRATQETTYKGMRCSVAQQAAALCYRTERGKTEVLLITTRGSGRWIIPKGWPIAGLTSAQSAAQEAWEEAGVKGACAPDCLGQFTYFKHESGMQPLLCLVDVFPLRVQTIHAEYPECVARKRRWFAPKKASLRVSDPELSSVLRNFGSLRH